jgi:2'-5' RNA ligase
MNNPRADLVANPRVRYGFYLRPSPAMSRAQAAMHDVLRRQFGLQVGGQFMPHATIMSFFRSDATLAEITAAIDPVMANRSVFPVWNNGPISMGRGIVIDVHHNGEGERNEAIQAVHEAAFAAITPLVRPDCEFAWGPWSGDNFHAHLTLAMADPPYWGREEVLEFARAEPIGPRTFMAEYFHLYAFHGDDWAGEWWHTMSWEWLHSWRLRG